MFKVKTIEVELKGQPGLSRVQGEVCCMLVLNSGEERVCVCVDC